MKNICRLPLFFLGLGLPALAGAQAGVALLVTTDMSCNWKLDGQPMGQVMTGDPKVLLVSPGEHLIDASTTDGLVTTRTKAEVDQVQRTVDIRLKSQYDQQLKVQQAEAGGEKSTWTDPATALMWTKWDNGLDVNWNQATAYCSDLKLAGYSGWRLPTIEELQGIYDPSISVRTLFDNTVTYNVHTKGKLKLTGWTWSSTQGDSPGKPWQMAWSLVLDRNTPGKFPLLFDFSMRALCVRRPAQ